MQVKKASDIKLAGIDVTIETTSNGLKSVSLNDETGAFVKFEMASYEALRAFVPAPPLTEKRWVLAGQVVGAEYRHAFGEKYEAEAALQGILDKLDCRDFNLLITEEDVPVEE